MRTQNKIPYQHSHLIMSTPSPSTPSPPKRPFPKGFVICPKRISDLLHFITRINYSSYHPVRYPYNTKYRRENLIILTSYRITSQFSGGYRMVANYADVHRSCCLILALLIDGRAISRDVIIATLPTKRIAFIRGMAWYTYQLETYLCDGLLTCHTHLHETQVVQQRNLYSYPVKCRTKSSLCPSSLLISFKMRFKK